MKKDRDFEKINELEQRIVQLSEKVDRDRVNYLKLVKAKPLHF